MLKSGTLPSIELCYYFICKYLVRVSGTNTLAFAWVIWKCLAMLQILAKYKHCSFPSHQMQRKNSYNNSLKKYRKKTYKGQRIRNHGWEEKLERATSGRRWHEVSVFVGQHLVEDGQEVSHEEIAILKNRTHFRHQFRKTTVLSCKRLDI